MCVCVCVCVYVCVCLCMCVYMCVYGEGWYKGSYMVYKSWIELGTGPFCFMLRCSQEAIMLTLWLLGLMFTDQH